MGRKPKISDEMIIPYIEQGLKDADIAKQFGVPQGNLSYRLKALRKTYSALPEMPDADGINYGKAKAAEYAKQHAKVDVEGIMAELKGGATINGMPVAKLPDAIIKKIQEQEQKIQEQKTKPKPGTINPEFDAEVEKMREEIRVPEVVPESEPDSFVAKASVRFGEDMREYHRLVDSLRRNLADGEPIDMKWAASYNYLIRKYRDIV